MDELLDVVSARVNLMLFFSLRLIGEFAEGGSPFRSFFAEYTVEEKLSFNDAICDLFRTYEVVNAIKILITNRIDEADRFMTRLVKRNDFDKTKILQLQVLETNVDYLLEKLKLLCEKFPIYS